MGPSRNSTLKRVEENGESDTGGEEVEEKFMAEERITEKEEFAPQQYTHQSSKCIFFFTTKCSILNVYFYNVQLGLDICTFIRCKIYRTTLVEITKDGIC